MKKLLLVDGHNVVFRSYFALPPMHDSEGKATHALYGFIRILIRAIRELKPDHIAVIFDGPGGKEKRKEIYPQYKAHREKAPDDLPHQIEFAQEFCKVASIPMLIANGYEADDIIGSIAKWAEHQDSLCYLLSNDKDLAQLVSKHIFLVREDKGTAIKSFALAGIEEVKESYGVHPKQIPDWLGIMGDSSDNIPGVEGIGKKGATDLLTQFSSLEEILDNIDKVGGPKKQAALKECAQLARLSKQLATIDIHADFPKDESFFLLRELPVEKLAHFYTKMNFRSLLKELGPVEFKPAAPIEKGVILGKGSYHLIHTTDELDRLIARLETEKALSFDTETTSLSPMDAAMVGIGLCASPKEAWYIPTNGDIPKQTVITKLKPLLENQTIHFSAHHFKYDLHVLRNEGIFMERIDFDTMIASYLVDPEGKHTLDGLSADLCEHQMTPIEELIGKGKEVISMTDVPIEKVSTYCCEDVDYTRRLECYFQKVLEKEQLLPLFHNIEMPLIPVLLQMERTGIYLDTQKLAEFSHRTGEKIASLKELIFFHAGEEFNINSTQQLSEVLFGKLGLTQQQKTKTGLSTNNEVLIALQNDHPIIPLLLEYRSLEKLRSTYGDSLPKQVNPMTKRIHCSFNQSVTATGRLSCNSPNLQNIPVRTKEGREIRASFRPSEPDWVFMSADYSQIELRLLAHLSQDPVLLEGFKKGVDIHAFTASQLFDKPISSVTAEDRHRAKTVNFGVLYGQGAFGLASTLSIGRKEAADFIKKYFERYAGVKTYIDTCIANVQKTGKTFTLTGRQRAIPDILSKNQIQRAAAERLAINTPLQGTNADMIKIAMIRIHQILQKEPHLGNMLLQIHDELLFEVPKENITILSNIVKKEMEGALEISVPIIVDVKVGINWGEW